MPESQSLAKADPADPPIIVIGRFRVEASQRQTFLEGRVPMQAATRREQGCLTYAASADPLEPDIINMIELWESRTAFNQHLAVLAARTPAELAEARKISFLEASIVRYEVAASGPL
jgi:quinol monooxygenase YgiN